MQDFTDFSGSNPGGCKSFEFIPINDISTIPDPESLVIDTAVTLRSGCSWYNGYATFESLKLDETQKNSRAGSIFEKKITGYYPKQSSTMLALFQEMDGQRFVVKITDFNDVVRLVGTIENPCIFSVNYSTGDKVAARNGYTFTFEQVDTDPAPVYDI